MQDWIVADADAGMRLDLWLARRAGAGSRSRASAWIERGKVFLGGAPAAARDRARRLAAGEAVGIWMDRPGSARASDRAAQDRLHLLRIVHEDAAVVAVDKPPGLIVEPLPGREGEEVTLLDLLAQNFRHDARAQFFVVHRIDRDTSGLVLVARTAGARDDLKDQFERRTPLRVYKAVLEGRVEPRRGTWRDSLAWDPQWLRQRRAHAADARAREAVAHYAVVRQFQEAALAEVTLVTGKRNQIRVQAGLRGHPLLGERLYRFDAPATPPSLPVIGRQALHAWTLGFVHPSTGRTLELTVPPPEDFAGLVAALGRRHA